MVVAMVAKIGAEEEARSMMDLFFDGDMLKYRAHVDRYAVFGKVLTRSQLAGHGLYRGWFNWCGEGSSTWCLTRFFAQVGYAGSAAVMDAWDGPLQEAGVCQRAVLLLCAAAPLPWLGQKKASACAAWFGELLSHKHAEFRFVAILAMQRLLAVGHPTGRLEASMPALLHDDSSAVCWAALLVLGALGRRRAAPLRGALLAQLEAPNASTRIRLAALKALRGLAPVEGPERELVAGFLGDSACAASALRLLQLAGATVAAHQEQLQRCRTLFAHLPIDDLFIQPLAHCCFRERCVLPLAVAARYVASGTASDWARSKIQRIAAHKLLRIKVKLRKFRQAKTTLQRTLQSLSKRKAKKLHSLPTLQWGWQEVIAWDPDGCHQIGQRIAHH
jgi:hypothetical protein